MTLQQLFASTGIDFKRVKLVRHNLSNKVINENFKKGYIDQYQTIQEASRFKNAEYILSFLGEDGTKGTYMGCYKVGAIVPFDATVFPDGFVFDAGMENCVMYKLERTNIYSDLINRLIIDWGKGTLNWCHNGSTEKEIIQILPEQSQLVFPGYDNIILSFEQLHEIVYNASAHSEWERKLSAVAGVYLITDTYSGKHYVGSACGEDGGIWNRWSEYAHTKHGGNTRLKKQIELDSDYCRYYQYSILEVLPLKRDKKEVLACESLYKEKLQSRVFGLNDN